MFQQSDPNWLLRYRQQARSGRVSQRALGVDSFTVSPSPPSECNLRKTEDGGRAIRQISTLEDNLIVILNKKKHRKKTTNTL